MLFIITLFLFITACSKFPTNLSQRNTYELIVKNGHWPPTFNIYINEQFVGFIDTDIDSGVIKNMGKFVETEITHFQSFFADSPFSLLDDTTITTINCDSIIFMMAAGLIAYYEN